MFRVIGLRLIGSIGAIFGATLLAFVIMRVLPGNPGREILGPLATPQAVTALNHQLGLDQPLYVPYWRYSSAFFKGDWDCSRADAASVKAPIGEGRPPTIEVALFSFVMTILSAIGFALLATY